MKTTLLVAWVAGFASTALVAPRAAALPPGCIDDAALAEAALELLSNRDAPPTSGSLTSAIRAAGSNAVAAHARLFSSSDAASAASWIAELSTRADAPLACGEADDGHRTLLVVAEAGGRLELVPGAEPRLRVTLASTLARPHLVVEDAEGRLVRLTVDAAAMSHGVVVPEGLVRPLVVQLVAEGRHGPRPVAQRTLFATADGALGPSSDGDDDVAGRIAALRVHRGAGALRPNRLLAAEAQAHAARVCREGVIAHRLEDGDPEERLARRGVVARVVGEAVARARTLHEALAALADSPSHLMTLVDRRFTDAGYGQGVDAEGKRCVVVLLAAWPRMLGR